MAKRQTLDPRQITFLTLYHDPNGKTFGNALQSALAAGYTQEYAESITAKMPAWLAENSGDAKLLHKAERNLDEMLDLEPERVITASDGSERKKYSTEILKVKADVTKFVASTVGRKRFKTKEDGGDKFIQNNFFNLSDLLKRAEDRESK